MRNVFFSRPCSTAAGKNGFTTKLVRDMGYLTDTGNNDVRTEACPYGMMMRVQLDKKEEFDRRGKWT